MSLRTGDIIMNLFKRSPKWKKLSEHELIQLKNTLSEIADDLTACCERNNLTYIMAYGTALGAVRHKGFIPWDDDMDFCMPRADYNRFLEIAERELGDRYYIRSVSKGDHVAVSTCHIRKKDTRYINYGDLVVLSDEPDEMRGIYIDIFPLENCSDKHVIRKIDGIVNLGIQFIISCIALKKSVSYFERLDVKLTEKEKKAVALKYKLGRLFDFMPLYRWYLLLDRFASKNKNDHSDFVTSYTGYKNLSKSTYLRKKILETRDGEFEGRIWKLPMDYDYYLRKLYGDYWKLPDEKHQKVHPVFELDFGTDKEK